MGTNVFGILNSRTPFAVYPVLARVGFGLPSNAMIVSGDAKHNFVSIMFATKDLAAGEEIVMDVTQDWGHDNSMSRRWSQGEYPTVKLSDRQIQLLDRGMTRGNNLSKEEGEEFFMAMFSNGLGGKWSGSGNKFDSAEGCLGLTPETCRRKEEIKNFVVSGDIWKMMEGTIPPPSWTGEIRNDTF